MKPHNLDRLTKIARRYAWRFGVSAAVYANHKSFDILTERKDNEKKKIKGGIAWLKNDTGRAYTAPAALALDIRRKIKEVWA
jgi:hypothetical protein